MNAQLNITHLSLHNLYRTIGIDFMCAPLSSSSSSSLEGFKDRNSTHQPHSPPLPGIIGVEVQCIGHVAQGSPSQKLEAKVSSLKQPPTSVTQAVIEVSSQQDTTLMDASQLRKHQIKNLQAMRELAKQDLAKHNKLYLVPRERRQREQVFCLVPFVTIPPQFITWHLF